VRRVSSQSKSFTKRKRERTLIVIGLVLVVISTVLFVASRLTQAKAFSVSVIEVQGASQDIIAAVRQAAASKLEGSYLKLFSRSNIFLYPRAGVREAVQSTSPRIETVSVRHAGLTSLVVTIKEKEPVALVCTVFPDFEESALVLPADNECFFADEQGVLFKAAPSISGTMYNRYFVPSLGTVATTSGHTGQSAAPDTQFTALQELYAGLRKSGLEVEGILFKDKGEYEAYVRAGEKTTVIYFNSVRPLSAELSDLILFWNHARDEARTKKKPTPQYEYVDVRYSPNLFFREIRGEEK
jgi:hypothetical protein